MNYRDGFKDGIEETISAIRLMSRKRLELAEILYEGGSVGLEGYRALCADSKTIDDVANFIQETKQVFFNDEQSGAV